ncbi:MAG: GNAT family N-acetyltransferase [Acidimicrobiia bacterium]
MNVAARPASMGDLEDLVRLYRLLADEMREYHPMWELADGLAEPVIDSLRDGLQDRDTVIYLGTIDDVIFGFILARSESLLAQAQGERIGSIRFVFTEQAARQVGIGESMRDAILEELRGRGLRLFDAHVLPGHRLVKNFFESGGFSARSIVMHHRDD